MPSKPLAVPARRHALRALIASMLLTWLPQALPATAPDDGLKAGEYWWTPELAPGGPLVIVVSLPEQRARVYRNGIRIGVTSISSGRRGYETPPGVYAILQKRREHYSNLYDDAPMPYMQRLTWDGVALHGGHVTGKPASHGCVRLPESFAEKLFEVTERGMTVIIADGATPVPNLERSGILAPTEAAGAAPRPRRYSPPQRYHLSPGLAGSGPISVLISSADAAVVVLRGGSEIARARIDIEPGVHFGLHAWVMLEGDAGQQSAVVPGRREHQWMELALPAHAPEGHRPFDAAAVNAFRLPPPFLAAIHDWLEPGATVILTDEPVEPGRKVTVLDATEEREG